MKFLVDVNPNPPTSPLGFSGISINIKYPDGSNVTLGPFMSNIYGEVILDFVPDQIGNYSVKLTFSGQTSSDGNYYRPCEAVTNFTVQAEPAMVPIAIFTFNPTPVEVNKTVNFDASNSSDSYGTIIDYVWDFGDGNTDTGVTASHSYTSDGSYTVTLTVVYNDAFADITTKTISDMIPEFPSWIVIPLFTTATLSAATVCRRLTKRLPTHNSQMYKGTIVHLS